MVDPAGITGRDRRSTMSKLDRECAVTLMVAIENCDRRITAEVLVWWLEENLTGGPIPAFFDLPGEAAIWATSATPLELETYLHEILTEIGRTAFHINAQKRIFANLWAGFSDPDKVGFLRKYVREAGHDAA